MSWTLSNSEMSFVIAFGKRIKKVIELSLEEEELLVCGWICVYFSDLPALFCQQMLSTVSVYFSPIQL